MKNFARSGKSRDDSRSESRARRVRQDNSVFLCLGVFLVVGCDATISGGGVDGERARSSFMDHCAQPDACCLDPHTPCCQPDAPSEMCAEPTPDPSCGADGPIPFDPHCEPGRGWATHSVTDLQGNAVVGVYKKCCIIDGSVPLAFCVLDRSRGSGPGFDRCGGPYLSMFNCDSRLWPKCDGKGGPR